MAIVTIIASVFKTLQSDAVICKKQIKYHFTKFIKQTFFEVFQACGFLSLIKALGRHQKSTLQKQPPEVLYGKGYLKKKNCKIHRKKLCQSFFFNEVAGLEPCNFIKIETLAQVFPVNFFFWNF